ncbi:MAG: exodeoxyribonuclease V subunit beta [Byssovorax sp.]
MQPLDALTTPLERSLIEASAGTGKTYTITTLVLRLLLERGLPIGKILVVTFTNAATRELYDRVRTRIRDALTAFEEERSDDEVLSALLLHTPDRDRASDQLKTALRDFDDAAIFTIHGLCQRILHEHAFESGTSFDAELTTSQESLLTEVVDDFFAQTLYEASPALVRQMIDAKVNREMLMGLARKAVADPTMPVLPAAAAPEQLEAALAAFEAAKVVAAAAWTSDRALILKRIDDAKLHQGRYRTATVDAAAQQMDQLLRADRRSGTVLFTSFKLFTTENLAGATKRGGVTPAHPFFGLCDALAVTGAEANRDTGSRLLQLQRDLIAFARREMPIRKDAAHLQSFDDLLHRLDAALTGPLGPTLAAAVRERYQAALIDEFQDTDPVQYRIFEAIYRGGEASPRFFIGDPKQAIYSFRGADVFAYLGAARHTVEARRFTLGTSYRSDPGLVQALNTLFGRPRAPFLLDQIRYSPVLAAKTTRMHQGEAPVTPFRILFHPREAPSSARATTLTKGSANRTLPDAVAADISRLLASGATIEGRPVCPGDIAILVRKNQQAIDAQTALRELRIPCVLQGDASVFDTPEALEMQQLLAAMAAPSNGSAIRLALTTSVFGLRADEVESLDRDDAAWDTHAQRFQSWGARFRDHGFIAGFRSLLDELQVPSRLLGWTDGERRLTNLLHLAELLHVAQIREHLGPAGLLRWLSTARREQDARDEAGAEAAQMRLESDDAAVKLVTIHKSKGLEYPIVYCPYLWDGKLLHKPEEKMPMFHEPPPSADPQRKLDLGSPDLALHAQYAAREAAAEGLRLLYVALTRARHQCTVVWGSFTDAKTSALGYLLHQDGAESGDLFAATSARLAGLDDAAMRVDLAALVEAAKGTIAVETLSLDPGEVYSPVVAAIPELEFRPISRALDASWRTSSFSGLVAGGAEARPDEGRDRDGAVTADPSVDTESIAAESAEGELVLLHAFPRGARPGEMLHKVFEDIEFGAPEAEIAAVAAASLTRFGVAPPGEWKDLLGRAVREALETPLRVPQGPAAAAFTLRGVPRSKRLNELEFIFPIGAATTAPERRLTAKTLGGVFERHPSAAVPASYAAALGRLAFLPLEGFLRGFIDLVFEHDGRYYVVDYKSNHLGPRPGDYGDAALTEAMAHHHYFLQYHLYAVAVHRYLAARLPGYDYDRDFGGVFYLFVRGMAPGRGDNAGVFADRPSRELIFALAALFAGESGEEAAR